MALTPRWLKVEPAVQDSLITAAVLDDSARIAFENTSRRKLPAPAVEVLSLRALGLPAPLPQCLSSASFQFGFRCGLAPSHGPRCSLKPRIL